ncbi:MAG: flagellar biosynthesis protein FlhB [Candidatus Hydrogenedentota bacterium]
MWLKVEARSNIGSFFIKDVIRIDLQWFAAEDEGRTEKPTGKKLGKARSEGKVPKSQFLNQAVLLFTGFMVLYYLAGWAFRNLMWFTTYSIQLISDAKDFSLSDFTNILFFTMFFILKILSPFLIIAIIVAIVINIIQSGIVWSFNPFKFDFNRVLPHLPRFFTTNIFSRQAAVNFIRTIALLVIISFIEYKVIKNRYDEIPYMMMMGVMDSVRFTMDVTFNIFLKVLILMLIIGIADYLFQKYEYIQSLMMRPEEVKDELRQAEGDPLIKKELRKRQFAMSAARMMREVPKADVVITNPTHYAVALKYDQLTMDAPMCIAKGKNYLALKIKEIAIQYGIPIEENKELAKALYDTVEIGDFIPAELYRAVAEILGRIFRMRNRRKAA